MQRSLPFHMQLRYERERRGWSQADLASRVGSDPKTVARWERGESLPRPYHRQALCELFGKNAEEFGLISAQRAIIPPFSETDPLPLPPAAISNTMAAPREGKARTYQNIRGGSTSYQPKSDSAARERRSNHLREAAADRYDRSCLDRHRRRREIDAGRARLPFCSGALPDG